ncbi:carbohydrate kinase [Crocosphaera sp. XPORK-15E]|uniref:carbohydrate kinase family protein n=1 Tax=Crocosphaera sp. XPORK-15E TaxID=3110247 RepID=UPI002B2218A6|nr:carbohydrate kinase [Crocosphaera sp. XPORK-15E]MEA5533585.1 carbohydrate kinase [Crocosphaera sp. XPORK-15E]
MMNQTIIIFGEVLFDCFPDGNNVLGGAPFNVAWHLQAFGISPLFISRVGNDSYGESIKKAMKDWGMNLDYLQTDSHNSTGIVSVNLIDNEPHYDIVESSAYDFIEFSNIPDLPQNSILYHGTLARRNTNSAITLEQIKKSISPSIFFDVNLRSPYWDLNTIESLLKNTSWLKLNEEELSLIVPHESNINNRINYLFSVFPLNQIILTQGKAGATLFTSDNINQHISPSQTTTIVDTVGAGDAFCSVLLLGILKNWDVSTTLTRAQQFASAIVGIQGATSDDRSFYQGFLKQWEISTMDNG